MRHIFSEGDFKKCLLFVALRMCHSKHWTEMFLYKWGICILFWSGLLLLGQPIGVKCDVSSEETQSTAANECKVHVEKALEEYWDKKSTSKDKISDPLVRYSNYVKEETNLRTNLDERDTRTKHVINKENNDDSKTNNDEKLLTNEGIQTTKEFTQEENLQQLKHEHQNKEQDEAKPSNTNKENLKISNQRNADSNEYAEMEKEDDKNRTFNDKANNETNSSSNELNIKRTIETNAVKNLSENKEHDESKAGIKNSPKKVRNGERSEKDNVNIKYDSKRKISSEASFRDKITNIDEDDEYDPCADLDEEGEEELLTNEQDKQDSQSNILSNKIQGTKEEHPTSTEAKSLEAKDTKPEQIVNSTEHIKILHDQEKLKTQTILNATKSEFESDKNKSDELTYIEDEDSQPNLYRSREHVDILLGLDELGSELEKEEEKLTISIFKEIKKIESTHIKTIEQLYKFADSTTRTLGDAEIFNLPMLLFLGPWSAGKTSIINYILGVERTPAALKTGTGITDTDFTILCYGNQRRILSGTELSADWRYAGLQKFGQGFLEHFRSIQIPHPLLRKVNIVDTPGIQENKKNIERGYSLNAVFQWFIDRADGIYVVLDPTKVDIGAELGSVIGQLKGRDVRFILNKADAIQRSDLIRVVGQLFWNLSPLMLSTEAPIIYAVSLTTQLFQSHAPAKFLEDQEKNLLTDMKNTIDKRIDNRILYARKHAVLVRNHAKLVDCYLSSYYWHKSIFKNKRTVAKSIVENPQKYNIYEGLSSMANISKYDLPNSLQYQEFFKLHPLYDFKPLASTCSYFRGCPMEKLDLAIAKEFPELLAKYKKAKVSLYEIPYH